MWRTPSVDSKRDIVTIWELPCSNQFGDLNTIHNNYDRSERFDPTNVPDATFKEAVVTNHGTKMGPHASLKWGYWG
jgi:hypothetical protein